MLISTIVEKKFHNLQLLRLRTAINRLIRTFGVLITDRESYGMRKEACFENIQALVFDVDGVFTDSLLQVTERGELLRRMNTRDGLAVKMALGVNLNIGVITGGNSQGVALRLRGLGVEHYFAGVSDKLPVLKQLLDEWGISPEALLYMGDDLPDLACIQYAGIGACPANAATEALKVSDYVSPVKGGAGCVRDVIERVMKSQNLWPAV